METTLSKRWPAELATTICASIAGCCLIILCSLIHIPFYPVPFTMQTFAIFFLGLTQTPRQAFGSGICYLASASAGLPVLCGKVGTLWVFGKCGGYLVAFPIAAWLIAKLLQKLHPYTHRDSKFGILPIVGPPNLSQAQQPISEGNMSDTARLKGEDARAGKIPNFESRCVYLALLCGQIVIYLLGFIWLTSYFDAWTAFMQGVIIFLPSTFVKTFAAVHAARFWRKLIT